MAVRFSLVTCPQATGGARTGSLTDRSLLSHPPVSEAFRGLLPTACPLEWEYPACSSDTFPEINSFQTTTEVVLLRSLQRAARRILRELTHTLDSAPRKPGHRLSNRAPNPPQLCLYVLHLFPRGLQQGDPVSTPVDQELALREGLLPKPRGRVVEEPDVHVYPTFSAKIRLSSHSIPSPSPEKRNSP